MLSVKYLHSTATLKTASKLRFLSFFLKKTFFIVLPSFFTVF